MKKLLPIAVALFAMTGLIIASCTKTNSNPSGNYTCHCSISQSGTTTPVDLSFNAVTKSTATSDCALAQANYTNAATGATAVCA